VFSKTRLLFKQRLRAYPATTTKSTFSRWQLQGEFGDSVITGFAAHQPALSNGFSLTTPYQRFKIAEVILSKK
jgi:hypothetical protein